MSMDTPTPTEGSLERLRIALETSVPAEILTPNTIRAMRLRRQRPIGYSYEDFEHARQQMIDTATWFFDALHRRDLDVHTLGEQLDRAQVDNQALRIELADAAYNAPVAEAIRQSDSDPEIEILSGRVGELQGQLGQAEQANTRLQAELGAAQAESVELAGRLAEALARPTPVAAEPGEPSADDVPDERDATIARLEAELALEQARVVALNTYREQTDAYITQIEGELEAYEQAADVDGATPVEPVAVPLPAVDAIPLPAPAEPTTPDFLPLEEEIVAPVGYESAAETDEDEESRDTDPDQPSDPTFFEHTVTHTEELSDSDEQSSTPPPAQEQDLTWNPSFIDDGVEDELVNQAGRNMPTPRAQPASPQQPTYWHGKALPGSVRLDDLEEQ